MGVPSLASSLALPVVTSFAGAQTLWWPCSSVGVPQVVLLFLPGNPGVSSYYIQFLHSIYTDKAVSGAIEIVSISQRGHALLPAVGDNAVWGDNARNQKHAHKGYGTTLHDQLRHKIAALDAIRAMYPDRAQTKIVLVGHSIGAWMAVEALKQRPDAIDALHLLFPTLAWISRTPCARRLQLLLSPLVTSFVLPIPLFVLSLLPAFLLMQLISLFTAQPAAAALATVELLTTPGAVQNALKMAKDEFDTLNGLDKATVDAVLAFTSDQRKGFVRSYFSAGETDSWAPGWIRSQVEAELQLQRVQLPASFPLATARVASEGVSKRHTRTRSFSVSDYRSSPGSIPDLRHAKAMRRPNGEIAIEAQVVETSNDEHDEVGPSESGRRHDPPSMVASRSTSYAYARARATSTHCRFGMPHAFCIHHSDDMAQIVSHWITHDHLKHER